MKVVISLTDAKLSGPKPSGSSSCCRSLGSTCHSMHPVASGSNIDHVATKFSYCVRATRQQSNSNSQTIASRIQRNTVATHVLWQQDAAGAVLLVCEALEDDGDDDV